MKVLFVLCGFLHLATGVFLAGAGHGWVTGLFFSFLSLLVFLLLAVFGVGKKFFCFFLIGLNVAATIGRMFKTKAEGIN